MRALLLIVTLPALAVIGCDRSPKAFGRSYDECILKNATTGGDQDSREVARDICKRQFVRRVGREEYKRDLSNGASIVTIPGVAQFGIEDEKVIRFTAQNHWGNATIVRVTAAANFYDKPMLPGGQPDPTAKVTELTWDFPTEIGPYGSVTLQGTFGEQGQPSEHWDFASMATMIIPMPKHR